MHSSCGSPRHITDSQTTADMTQVQVDKLHCVLVSTSHKEETDAILPWESYDKKMPPHKYDTTTIGARKVVSTGWTRK